MSEPPNLSPRKALQSRSRWKEKFATGAGRAAVRVSSWVTLPVVRHGRVITAVLVLVGHGQIANLGNGDWLKNRAGSRHRHVLDQRGKCFRCGALVKDMHSILAGRHVRDGEMAVFASGGEIRRVEHH